MEGSEERASLRFGAIEDAGRQKGIRESIENLSGLRGAPLFMLDRWMPVSPVERDGVDLSNLVVQDFLLRRSEGGDYRLRRANIAATLSRPGTFFEIGFGDGKDGGFAARITNSMVALMFRSPGGRYVELSRAGPEQMEGCEEFEVTPSGGESADSPVSGKISVQCNGREITSTIVNVDASRGRVFASSNLVRDEVRVLSLLGRSGDAENEDTL